MTLELISNVWFLLVSVITVAFFLIGGIIRFEMALRASAKEDKTRDKRMASLEKKLSLEVERLGRNSGKIEGLQTDIAWVKETMRRIETNLNQFMIAYPASLLRDVASKNNQ